MTDEQQNTQQDLTVGEQPQQVDTSETVTNTQPNQNTPTKNKKKWPFAVALVVALLVIGGGVYAFVLKPSPKALWNSAMTNTSTGIQEYINQPKQQMQGASVDGTITVVSPVSASGKITGYFDENNSTLTLSLGVLGQNGSVELRTLQSADKKGSDVYIKLDGGKLLSGLLAAQGSDLAPLLQQLDGKWFVLSDSTTKTLLNSQSQESQTGTITQEALQNAMKDVATVLNDYVFTTDQNKAVIWLKEPLQKEDFNGRSAQKYNAQIRKQQLLEMVSALETSLKNTQLVSQLGLTSTIRGIDTTSLRKQIEALDESKMVAEVWVDTALQYMRNIRFTQTDTTKNQTNQLDITLDYTGGNDYPISLRMTTKEKDNENTTVFGVTVRKDSPNIDVNVSMKGSENGQNTDIAVAVKLAPTADKQAITKPEGAVDIMTLLSGLLTGMPQAAGNTSPLQTLLQ